MRSGYQLFGPSQLGNFWNILGENDGFPDDYRDTLLALAAGRESLPAPVYFQMPTDKDQWEDPRWQELINASQQQCRCAERRMLVPTVGRARFVQKDLPELVVITSPDGEPITTSSVLFLPHGGDAAAAHLSWSFDDGWPTCIELPLHKDRPQRQSVTFGHGLSPSYDNGIMRFDPAYLEDTVLRHGEVICYRTLLNGKDRVVVPVCSIVGVRRGGESGVIRLSIEADASVSYVFPDKTRPLPLHVCRM